MFYTKYFAHKHTRYVRSSSTPISLANDYAADIALIFFMLCTYVCTLLYSKRQLMFKHVRQARITLIMWRRKYSDILYSMSTHMRRQNKGSAARTICIEHWHRLK